MPLYCNVLAFAYKSLCQVCLLRAKIVMMFRFDVDLRDSAYMDAFDFEKSGKKFLLSHHNKILTQVFPIQTSATECKGPPCTPTSCLPLQCLWAMPVIQGCVNINQRSH